MEKLRGKIVWITGASSGIGEALAIELAKEKATLVLSSRRKDELLRVKLACNGAQRIEILPLDVEMADEIPVKVKWVIETMGSIDMVIHCAGVSQRSIAAETSMAVNNKIMAINYFGTVALSLAVLPHFLQNNKGQFVVMSSLTGKIGLPLRTAYSASKHAIEGFFAALRTETWRTKIKILVVRAGAVKTNIADAALTGNGEAFNKKDPIIENGISAAQCAEEIVQAILDGRRELTVSSFKEKLLLTIQRFLPSLAFNLVKKLGDKS